MTTINIFKEHAAAAAERNKMKDAKEFLHIGYYLQANGQDKTREALGNCIDSARYINSHSLEVFFSFALTEIHS